MWCLESWECGVSIKYCIQCTKTAYKRTVFTYCGCFVFKHSLVHLQSLPSHTDRYVFESIFNAIIQKTIYISIFAVCELDIKDKKQVLAQMKNCVYCEV